MHSRWRGLVSTFLLWQGVLGELIKSPLSVKVCDHDCVNTAHTFSFCSHILFTPSSVHTFVYSHLRAP